MERRYEYMNDIDSCNYHLSEMILKNWEKETKQIQHVQTQSTHRPQVPK